MKKYREPNLHIINNILVNLKFILKTTSIQKEIINILINNSRIKIYINNDITIIKINKQLLNLMKNLEIHIQIG
jgi:hypothetical protein